MSALRGRVAGLPEWDRCAVMGVVNVTPDSFSDGGLWRDPELAVKHGLDLIAAGADLVDVGGESTRPGARRVDAAEELRRVIPVVRELAAADVLVSVDTMRASVAARAVEAGARLVNDVSGGLADPAMVPMVAEAGIPFVVMHWRGQSVDMNNRAIYGDVVTEVVGELRRRLDEVVAGGVDPEHIVIDPGLGFAKDAPHDLALMAHLQELRALGRPLLVAASRKRFLGRVLAGGTGDPPARLPPPPSTEALRAAVTPARLPPPPSTEALRAAVTPARLPPPPSTEALRAAVTPARLPPPPSTEALRAAVTPARLPPPPSTEALRAAIPPARERDAATAAVSAIAAHEGAWAVRVHDVRPSADAVRVARAIEEAL